MEMRDAAGAAVASQVLGILVGASIVLFAAASRSGMRLTPPYRAVSAVASR